MSHIQIEQLLRVLDAASYDLNFFALPVFFTALAIVVMGISVLVRERFSSVSFAFFLMTLPVSIWLFSFTAMYLASDRTVALWWSKTAYWGVPFIPSAIYYFTVKVLRLYESRSWLVALNFILSALIAAVILNTGLLIKDVYHYTWGYYPKYEPVGSVYLVFFFAIMILSLQHYWSEYKKPQTDTHKARIQWLFLAFTIAYAASLDYLAKFGIPFYPFGYVSILGFVAVAAYVMKRYRLVDITPALAVDKIIGTMGDALLVLDAENVIRVANQSACQLLQMDKKDLIGKPIASVSLGFPLKTTVSALERIGQEHGYEIQHMLPDGPSLTLAVSESSLKDHMGCVIATVLILRDMTPLKQVQSSLQEVETRCDELYNSMPDAILVLDELGRFRSMNPAAERLLGLVGKKVAGRIFVMSNILPSQYMTNILKVIRAVMEGKQEPPFDLELMRESDNTVFVVKAYPSAVRQGGKVVGVQLILRDVLEQKKLEEVLQKARADMETRMRKSLDDLIKNHEELRTEIAKLKF